MDNTIKETVVITIHNLPVECYITEDKIKYIGRNIERLFRTCVENASLVKLSNGVQDIEAYTIDTVVTNIKPSIGKELIGYGLDRMIDANNHLGSNESEMSEFDKNIQKALGFNPNK